ncbi:sulfurtransferase [Ottowia sp.]|uniref:sulfurtransferase n=1 Tax=Ottowia sp. TaxID=1898956 RepID=UPI003A8615ED
MYTHLITTTQLQQLQAETNAARQPVLVFDCTADLADPTKADTQFASGHIAGAVQAHLERNLSATRAEDAVNGGRHPLPKREIFTQWLQALGMNDDTQAVVYDRNGSAFCGRLWWMLKWVGHDAVAVLDGGWAAWQAAGGAVASGPATPRPTGHFSLRAPLRRLVRTDEVAAQLGQPTQTVVDARAAARYRGDEEPLDPVAGHIPGALNRPFTDNFAEDGRFKPAAQLNAEWTALLAGRDATSVVHQCGSGVTAIPNALAMELAGFAPVGVYAGSWSEWSRTPRLPCAQG